MAKRGPKPSPSPLKVVAGTDRPDRANVVAFEVPEGDAELPAQFQTLLQTRPLFAAIVLEIWNSQVAKYRDRNQSTAGYSRALYQMCMAEAELHEKSWNGQAIDTAARNSLRLWYSEFHDTPASNLIPAGRPGGNRFGNNGKPRKP